MSPHRRAPGTPPNKEARSVHGTLLAATFVVAALILVFFEVALLTTAVNR